MSFRICVFVLVISVCLATNSIAARAGDCPVHASVLSLEGKGTLDQFYRYRLVLETASGESPSDVDLQIQTEGGRLPIDAKATHLRFFADEDDYDTVVLFDRATQDVSGIAVVGTTSGDASIPCTSLTVKVGDQPGDLAGWNLPTVIGTFGDADKKSLDGNHIALLAAISKDATFKNKADLSYPPMALNMGVTGEAEVHVHLGATGQLESTEIKTSSGSKLLDAAALDAARRSTFSGPLLDGIPIVSDYKIVYEFRLDSESYPPSMSDLLKIYCPAILDNIQVSTGLNAGQAFWYELNMNTVQAPIDSVDVVVKNAKSSGPELLWKTLLRGFGDTMGIGRDASLDYSTTQGALFWPGPLFTSATVAAETQRTKKTAACKPYPTDVQREFVSDSLVAVTKTEKPWLTAPVIETVLPARFATKSWPNYPSNADRLLQPVAVRVNVHVSPAGEPLVAVVHDVSSAPVFAAAALNAAMTSMYVVPHSADGTPLTQTFDIDYVYVPASAAAGKPVGLVSHDRSDGNRRSTPHD